MPDLYQIVTTLSVWVLPVLFAITLHEAAHGYVAYAFGDPTAKSQGRLSLNPLKHIDPFGTVLMPLLLFFMAGFVFGYAKPVPVDFRNLRNPKRDMMFVAIAGPAANIVLAIAGALFLGLVHVLPDFLGEWYAHNLVNLIMINTLLAVFNLLPLPPLDGSRVVSGLLPHRLAVKYNRLEPYGIFILIGMLFILPKLGQLLGLDFNIAEVFIWGPAHALYNFILSTFGTL